VIALRRIRRNFGRQQKHACIHLEAGTKPGNLRLARLLAFPLSSSVAAPLLPTTYAKIASVLAFV